MAAGPAGRGVLPRSAHPTPRASPTAAAGPTASPGSGSCWRDAAQRPAAGGAPPPALPGGRRRAATSPRTARAACPQAGERWAEDMLDPKVDWRRVLAAEIRKGCSTVSGRVDYTYRRPSRRAQASARRRPAGPGAPRARGGRAVRHVGQHGRASSWPGAGRGRRPAARASGWPATGCGCWPSTPPCTPSSGSPRPRRSSCWAGAAPTWAPAWRRRPSCGPARRWSWSSPTASRRGRPTRPRACRWWWASSAAAARGRAHLGAARVGPRRAHRRRRLSGLMPRKPRWCHPLPQATATVPCNGEQHRVSWRRGKLKLEDHDLEPRAG